MRDVMCMNHPEWPADPTYAYSGPPLCTPCAWSAGLPTDGRPDVVTLCGSMRFIAELLDVAAAETSTGAVVLAPFVVIPPAAQRAGLDAKRKRQLDDLHRHKIRLSDRVIVVSDVTGYIGAVVLAPFVVAHDLRIPVEYRHVVVAAAPGSAIAS
jgi:hypothetical protein